MKLKFIAIVIFSVGLFIFSNNTALAVNPTTGNAVDANPPTNTNTVSLDNPLGKDNPTPQVLLGKIIQSVLGIVGSLALVMFIYGGITWMLSGGNQERVAKGKQILIWATIGIVIIFTAYALVRFVLTTIAPV